MIAAAPAWVVDAGTIAGALCASVGAVVVALRSRPVRWFGRTVIAEPLGEWFDDRVEVVVDRCLDKRPLTNGWGTRAVHKIAEATGADVESPHTN